MKVFHINDPLWSWPVFADGEFPDEAGWLRGNVLTNAALRKKHAYALYVSSDNKGMYAMTSTEFESIVSDKQNPHVYLDVPCDEKLKRVSRIIAYGLEPCICAAMSGKFECPMRVPLEQLRVSLQEEASTRRTTSVYAGNRSEDGAGPNLPRALIGSSHSNSLSSVTEPAKKEFDAWVLKLAFQDVDQFVADLDDAERNKLIWALAKADRPYARALWAAAVMRR